MTRATRLSLREAIADLSREPLRNLVLLKQLIAFPDNVEVFRVVGGSGTATLLLLETTASTYDRQTYPKASFAAFVSSDHPELTALLLPNVPRDVGVIFKLASEADLGPVAAHLAVERRTAFMSFTSSRKFDQSPETQVTIAPGDEAFRMFESQGHERPWLEEMLRKGKAFACLVVAGREPTSACFAYENYGSIWEVGGVATLSAHRRKGLAARVVRTALAELSRRNLAPRYQVEEHNTASIELARSIGLTPFVTITHYVHRC